MMTGPSLKSTLANEEPSPTYLTTLFSKRNKGNIPGKINYDYNAQVLKK